MLCLEILFFDLFRELWFLVPGLVCWLFVLFFDHTCPFQVQPLCESILSAQYFNFNTHHKYDTFNILISILQLQLVDFNTSLSILEFQYAKYLQFPSVHVNIVTSRLNYSPLTELFQPQCFRNFDFHNSSSMFTV